MGACLRFMGPCPRFMGACLMFMGACLRLSVSGFLMFSMIVNVSCSQMPIDGRLPSYGSTANLWKDYLPLFGRSEILFDNFDPN